MISKLMKYDLKKNLFPLVIFYVISVSLAGLARIINIWNDIQIIKIIGSVFATLAYSAIASVLVNTFVHLFRMFINSFFKDESYLTHTLPVNKNQLLLSKYLVSLIVVFLSVVVSLLTLFIVLYSKEMMEVLKVSLGAVVAGFNMSIGGFLALMGFIIFAQIASIFSMGFCAIVKANTYNTKRVRRGVLWFLCFYFGAGVCALITIAIAFSIGGMANELLAKVMSQAAFTTALVVAAVLYSLYALLFYFVAKHIFNKGVNVD